MAELCPSEVRLKDMTKVCNSMPQPTFPVKNITCYFSKYAEYIFFMSWFIMTHGSNHKPAACKNSVKKITGLHRRSWHTLTVLFSYKATERYLDRFSPKGTKPLKESLLKHLLCNFSTKFIKLNDTL